MQIYYRTDTILHAVFLKKFKRPNCTNPPNVKWGYTSCALLKGFELLPVCSMPCFTSTQYAPGILCLRYLDSAARLPTQ